MTAVLSRPDSAPLLPEGKLAEGQESGSSGFRRDIQGLRAVAVLLVVLYHAKVPGVSGGYVGVDVFFAISGFLITGQLTRNAERYGRVRFTDFYLRRVRRLLPAAASVVVATVVAARLWAPPLQVKSIEKDAIWTAFYGINVRLAHEGVDYQHAGAAVSPLQHCWSLAVEEQFYIGWPLLVTAAFLLGRRHRRGLLTVLLLGAFAASLWYSISTTASSPSTAYFSILTRGWELGLGGLVAIAAPRLRRMPGWLASVLSWAGLAGVIASGFVFDDNTRFPGAIALVPVGSAAVLIAAGCARAPQGADQVLGRPVPQAIGKVSYSWYLWHWPILIIAPMALGHSISWIRNLELMGLALWIATLTYLLLETSLLRRTLHKVRWTAIGGVLTGGVVGVAVLVTATLPTLVGNGPALTVPTTATTASAAYEATVASVIKKSSLTLEAPSNLRPTLPEAADDLPASSKDTDGHCQAGFYTVSQGPCVYGDPKGTKTMVLFGDSHAEQWLPAFDLAGKRAGWKVVNWTKAACPAAQLSLVNPQLGRPYTECDQWRAATIARITALHPTLVVVSQSNSVPGNSVTSATWLTDTSSTLQLLQDGGVEVDYLLDTVYPTGDVPSCVSAHLDDVHACGHVDVPTQFSPRNDVLKSGLTTAGYGVLDPHDWECAGGFCPAVIGNLLVNRDDSHMTATYSAFLAPLVETLLTPSPAGSGF